MSNPKLSPRMGPGSEDDLDLRRMLSDVMRRCTERGKSREIIAKELSALIGRPVSSSMLNDYTKTGKSTARFPAAYVKALCEVADDDSLLYLLLTPRLRVLVEIGKRELAAQYEARTKNKLLAPLVSQLEEKASREAGDK